MRLRLFTYATFTHTRVGSLHTFHRTTRLVCYTVRYARLVATRTFALFCGLVAHWFVGFIARTFAAIRLPIRLRLLFAVTHFVTLRFTHTRTVTCLHIPARGSRIALHLPPFPRTVWLVTRSLRATLLRVRLLVRITHAVTHAGLLHLPFVVRITTRCHRLPTRCLLPLTTHYHTGCCLPLGYTHTPVTFTVLPPRCLVLPPTHTLHHTFGYACRFCARFASATTPPHFHTATTVTLFTFCDGYATFPRTVACTFMQVRLVLCPLSLRGCLLRVVRGSCAHGSRAPLPLRLRAHAHTAHFAFAHITTVPCPLYLWLPPHLPHRAVLHYPVLPALPLHTPFAFWLRLHGYCVCTLYAVRGSLLPLPTLCTLHVVASTRLRGCRLPFGCLRIAVLRTAVVAVRVPLPAARLVAVVAYCRSRFAARLPLHLCLHYRFTPHGLRLHYLPLRLRFVHAVVHTGSHTRLRLRTTLPHIPGWLHGSAGWLGSGYLHALPLRFTHVYGCTRSAVTYHTHGYGYVHCRCGYTHFTRRVRLHVLVGCYGLFYLLPHTHTTVTLVYGSPPLDYVPRYHGCLRTLPLRYIPVTAFTVPAGCTPGYATRLVL